MKLFIALFLLLGKCRLPRHHHHHGASLCVHNVQIYFKSSLFMELNLYAASSWMMKWMRVEKRKQMLLQPTRVFYVLTSIFLWTNSSDS